MGVRSWPHHGVAPVIDQDELPPLEWTTPDPLVVALIRVNNPRTKADPVAVLAEQIRYDLEDAA